MLLKSIKLENIRSYTNQEIAFNQGSTLLIGDIGSGKTTILLAIEFALFGLIKGDTNGSTLLRHGKREGSVKLTFEIDDKIIQIVRKLKRSKDESVTQEAGQIITNNSSFDGTPIELKSKMLELFGYPQELLNKNASIIYRYTVYTPQEDMKKILFESSEDRLDILRKIFNIDKYKRIRENALSYAKELRNEKKILEAKISDLEQLKESSAKLLENTNIIKENITLEEKNNLEIKNNYETLSSELKTYEDKILKLSMLKKDLEISVIRLNNKQLELDKNNKDLGLTEYRIKEYNNKLQDLGTIDQNEENIRLILTDSEDKLNKINSAKEILTKRLEDKQRDLQNIPLDDMASLNYQHQILTKRLEERSLKEKSLHELKIELEKIILELNTLTINKNNSSKVILQLKDLSTCPVCLQNVDFTHKVKILDKENAQIQSASRKFEEFKLKKQELEDKIKTSNSQIDQLHKDELELQKITIKLTNITKQQELKQTLIKEIEELNVKKVKVDAMDVNKLIELISRNRKILSNLEVQKHIKESLKEKELQKKEVSENIITTQDELKVLIESKINIETQITEYIDIEKKYIELKKETNIISEQLQESTIKIISIKKDLENYNKEIKRLTDDIELKNKLREKIIYISELNYWITEHFVNLTSTIEKVIMQKIHIELNELFQKWFKMLIDDETIEVKIDGEFTPIVIQNNYENDISNLSGGEKTAIALAYRLALNKVINDMINNIKTKDIIILDEPTTGFSSEQLDKMRDVLYELDIKQLIMVSHESKMESFVENVIRINKNEHNSQILL
jgi:exonuclease SbcC